MTETAEQLLAITRRQLTERDATIAALREALQTAADLIDFDNPGAEHTYECEVKPVLESSDPGAELLARHAAELAAVQQAMATALHDLHKRKQWHNESVETMAAAEKALRQRAEAAENQAKYLAGELDAVRQVNATLRQDWGIERDHATKSAVSCEEWRVRAEAGESAVLQYACGIPIPDDSRPLVKPEASDPCEVIPKPENAL